MQEMTGTIQGPKHIQRGDKKKRLKKRNNPYNYFSI